MALITVSQGGVNIPAGVYEVVLTAVEGPKEIVPNSGPNAGQTISIFDWRFAVDGGEYDGVEVTATTSVASGPRSKMFSFLTALLDGKPPTVGQQFDAPDLVGRGALATISVTEAGWPRIDQLSAVPATMRPPAPAPEPAARRAQRAPTTGVASGDDLPF